MRHQSVSRKVTIGVILTLVAASLLWFRQATSADEYTAYFERSTGLYTGNEVKVLGVKVGTVTAVTQESTRVRVDFLVDASQKVPHDVQAAIVAPSLVSGRFVQLAPAYTGGAVLPAGSTIPVTRTAVPVEFDEVKEQVTRLAKALGPTPENENGSLADLIEVASKNLDVDTAKNLHTSLRGMADAVDTISSSKDDIFATIEGVDAFVTNLVENESNLRRFSRELEDASGFLADDRRLLAETVEVLQRVLRELEDFTRTNRGQLASSIDGLAAVADTVAEEKVQLANVLHRAPTVMGNFHNIQDPFHGGTIGRPVLNYFSNVAQFTCGLILGVGGLSADCSKALQSMLQALKIPLALPGAPGNPVLTDDGANPLAPTLTGEGGLGDTVGKLAKQLNGGPEKPGLVDILLGGLR